MLLLLLFHTVLPPSSLAFPLPSPSLSPLPPQEQCQNYHHVLVYPKGPGAMISMQGVRHNLNDTVLVCGSYAFSPMCHYRQVRNCTSQLCHKLCSKLTGRFLTIFWMISLFNLSDQYYTVSNQIWFLCLVT